jgi:hypothetical protein
MNKNKIHEKIEDVAGGSPLYHHTSEERAISILNQNKLRGSLPDDDYLQKDKRLRDTKNQSAVSFTRDKNFQPGISIGSSWEMPKDLNVIFVLDRNKLATRYRIEPFNYSYLDPDFKDQPYEKNDELEERVLTKYIYPLDKYLSKIIYKGNDEEVKRKLEQFTKGKINELAPTSNGVKEFLADVKENKGALKALGFRTIKDLENYIYDSDYKDFQELKKELKKFLGRDVIEEQEQLERIPKIAVKIFNYVDSLRKENPKYKTRSEIEELIGRTLTYMGMEEGLKKYYTELYIANRKKTKKWEDLGPEDIIDPRTLAGKTTTNPNAYQYTKAMLPFKGSNLQGLWEKDRKGIPIYVVLSYRWYPIFLNKEGRWYEVVDRYSSSTARQIYNSDPTQLSTRWDKNLEVPVYLVNPDEMKKLRNGLNHEELMIGKRERLLGSREDLQKKRAQFSKTWGDASWPRIQGEEPEVPTKIKYKIKDVIQKDNKVIIQVDIVDVKIRRGNVGIDTPQNYLKGELPGITKEKIEKSVKSDLVRNFKEFIGNRLPSYYENLDLKDSLIDFEFNHVKKG